MQDFRHSDVSREMARIPVRMPSQLTGDGQVVEGILTSDVTPASPDGKSGATTFTIQLWHLDTTDAHDPQHLEQDSTDTAGVNTTNQTASTGRRAFCVYMYGRLQFLFADCP